MSGRDTRATPLAPGESTIDDLLARQRRAIFDRDPVALDSAGAALLDRVHEIGNRAPDPTLTRELQRAREGLRLNAELIGRARAEATRALGVIFGAEQLYRADGDGRIAQGSRPIDIA